ncbi:ATP-binding cassette domain-containing protein [Alginatibacterium sediminis]|uniref:ATP-binding cassette domain-containing protein n=1 Tax=Alginatibacterium sediminis TaxID=2164068 RepID=A0A420E8T8_9ALTE|nr:ABC transporter transmembrane domain-containing protein [Alginatibacterium sediminis]RKF15684.1 ATP-binding cassette domain-containing protein [Alginatibacterium sediminis]
MEQNLSQRRLISLLISFVKPYKWQLSFALIALLVTAGVSLSLGQGVRIVIDQGFITGSKEQLGQSLMLMFGLIVLLAIGTFARFYWMSWLGERVSADIRKNVFKHLMQMHPSYFENNSSGDLMSRLTTDTTLLQSIMGSSFSMALRSSLTMVGGIVLLLVTNLKLSLIVLACIPLILAPMIVYGRRVRQLARQSQDRIADVGTYAGESIRHIKVVQSYNQQAGEQQAFAEQAENAFDVAKKRIKQRSLLTALVLLLVFGAISAMLWFGGVDVLEGRTSAGDLGAFVFYALMVAMSVATISEVYGELQRAAGAAERIFELLDTESLIKEPATAKVWEKPTAIQIAVSNLNFHYPSRPNQYALKNVNLEIKAGEVLALVGPSGAGKSTLFELLQRFYDPDQGQISFNGINITELSPAHLRAQMAMVAQQPVLFSGSVQHNIAYGKPTATKKEIIAAAQKAHAHDFIQLLPKGYDSFVGENGVRLSGGQKQRIALARAILKDPSVLLLDEATSALDAQSEQHVQIALDELMRGRTTLIIAHRLSTVIHADRILVIDQGEVVASGRHQDLLQSNAMYKRLCELQFKGSSDLSNADR